MVNMEGKTINIPEEITVRELAQAMQVSPIDLIKQLMRSGIMANINQTIDRETATIVAEDLGFQIVSPGPSVVAPEAPVEEAVPPQVPRRDFLAGEEKENLRPRPPVVTVMGHVDHGKTSLLDAIRETKVALGEAGGITQQIGAYQAEKDARKITFLDTPGHEAFTAMRARGAQVTDIAVLVVAADDGVMPQTVEAINHAKAAGVPIVVALNKMDLDNIKPDLVKQQLANEGLLIEEWGGNVICVPVSAKTKQGLGELLESILAVAELSDLKANPNRPAKGVVIEGRLDHTRGPMATLLVMNGTLRQGDSILAGETVGRVRAMFNEDGKRMTKALPSAPVALLGLPEVPEAGSTFEVVADEREARALAQERIEARRRAEAQPVRRLSLEEVYQRFQAGEVKELDIVLKADAQGSLEAARDYLAKLGDEELKVNIIHQGTGPISESDVMLAAASRGIIIGYGVEPDPAGRIAAQSQAVDIRHYDIIYDLRDDVERALRGLLEPEYQEVVVGHAEVRATFSISRGGKVAGVYVLDGKVTRDSKARIMRKGNTAYEGQVASLKRFTENVQEVAAGYECGVGLIDFIDFVVGDVIEFYKVERTRGKPSTEGK